MGTETQVHARFDELDSCGRFPAKAMDYPRHAWPYKFVHTEQQIECANNVQDEGLLLTFTQLYLHEEGFLLSLQGRGGDGSVYATFAYGRHRRKGKQAEQRAAPFKKIVGHRLWMPSCGIGKTLLRRECVGMDIGRKADDGFARTGIGAVGVQIGEHGLCFGLFSRNGIVSASSPWVAAQNAPYGKIKSFHGAVLAKCFDGILRTGRRKTASRRSEGRNKALVELYGQDEHPNCHTADGVKRVPSHRFSLMR